MSKSLAARLFRPLTVLMNKFQDFLQDAFAITIWCNHCLPTELAKPVVNSALGESHTHTQTRFLTLHIAM